MSLRLATEDVGSLSIMAKLIQSGEISPVELAEAMLERIEAFDPQLDSYLFVTHERALGEARKAETELAYGRGRGPLHGIPYALKDIYDTAGTATTGHSRTAMDRVPDADASTVRRLESAGATLLGKLSTHEFAHGGPSFDLPWPPARNPWNREHFTGGSSSGSGAAVAAGLAYIAMGSDTGGSIRTPAGHCGVVGLKPTYGLVSRAGVIPNSWTFDHCGPLTWTVADCALAMEVLAGPDDADPASAMRPAEPWYDQLEVPVKGLRVGVLRGIWEEELPANDEMKAALEAGLEVLRGLGCILEDARMPPLQAFYDCKIVVAESELFSAHRENLQTRLQEFGRDFRMRSLPACLFTSADYVAAQRLRRRLIAAMQPLYDRYDLLIAPSTYGPAPRLDAHRPVAFWKSPNVTTPFNVTGGPALTQCIGFSASGLPLAWQVVGAPFHDARVMRLAHAYEAATDWRKSRPALKPGFEPKDEPPVHPASPDPDLDTGLLRRIEQCAAASGLDLQDEDWRMLCEAAPHALAMSARLAEERFAWAHEPSSNFHW